MNFIDIYERTLTLWPEEIDISDGYLTSKGKFYFKKLYQINDQIEELIDHDSDHWSSIVSWSFFQAFHQVSVQIKSEGGSTLKTREVPKELIDEKIRKNIEPNESADDWPEERKEYIGLNGTGYEK